MPLTGLRDRCCEDGERGSPSLRASHFPKSHAATCQLRISSLNQFELELQSRRWDWLCHFWKCNKVLIHNVLLTCRCSRRRRFSRDLKSKSRGDPFQKNEVKNWEMRLCAIGVHLTRNRDVQKRTEIMLRMRVKWTQNRRETSEIRTSNEPMEIQKFLWIWKISWCYSDGSWTGRVGTSEDTVRWS